MGIWNTGFQTLLYWERWAQWEALSLFHSSTSHTHSSPDDISTLATEQQLGFWVVEPIRTLHCKRACRLALTCELAFGY